MHVKFDYRSKRARADVLEGFEAGRSFIRRYDEKQEYMIEEVPQMPSECKRSYLGESMPEPLLPRNMNYTGLVSLGDRLCAHWTIETDGLSRVRVFTDATSGNPVRITEEWIEEEDASTPATPLMTYEFREFDVGPHDAREYSLPAPFAAAPKRKCERQIGGYPYVNIFHWYVRF
eukprot:g833.t1